MSEFTKGFSRGLGYGAANIVMNCLNNSSNTSANGYVTNVTITDSIRQSTNLKWWVYVLAVFSLGCGAISIFGIILLIYGINRYFKSDTSVLYMYTGDQHITDRRYKCGYRVENIAGTQKGKEPATDEERAVYKKQGLIISAGVLIYTIIISIVLFAIK